MCCASCADWAPTVASRCATAGRTSRKWAITSEPSFTKGSHMKYLLINGVHGNDTSYKNVLTGSLNWTDGALAAGDEVVLQHENAATHSAYVTNFRTMFGNRTYTTVLRNY